MSIIGFVVAEFTGRMTGSGVKSTPVVRRIPITPRPTIPDNSEVKLGYTKECRKFVSSKYFTPVFVQNLPLVV